MPQVLLKRQDTGEEFVLTDRATLGRHHENDIVLHDDPISRHHCVFFLKNRDFFVKDLGSLNGMFLNEQPVHESKLSDGDQLKAGSIEFRVSIVDLEIEPADSEPKFSSIIFDPYFRSRIVGVHVRSGSEPFTEYFLECNSVSTIGRMSICDIPINNTFVSRNNTTIDVRDHRVMIADVSSTNGTFVNGERIINSELKDGDRFSIAEEFDFDVRFEYDQSNSLDSVEHVGDVYTMDLIADAEKLLELYDRKYGDRVLLEVERQTLVLCDEVGNVSGLHSEQSLTKPAIQKFLYGISRAERLVVIDPRQSMNSADLEAGLTEIVSASTLSRMMYFESGRDGSGNGPGTNGLLIRLSDEFQLVLYGLRNENILYLIYAAGWLGRIRPGK